jgi:GNAT superfamily N-acetyltransferase
MTFATSTAPVSTAGYSAPPETRLRTWRKFEFSVRGATPQDEQALAYFFAQVTPDDKRFRFLTSVKKVGHSFLERLTNVDHEQTEDFLAFDGDTLIASAMLALDQDKARAEVAITVRADYKHRGVGWTLLNFVANYVAAKGVGLIESVECRDNFEAIALEKEMGFTATAYPDDPRLVLVQKRLN